MFRFLGRLIVALFVLFVMRLFFATARRVMNRSPRSPLGTPERRPTIKGKPAGRPSPPRIDRSAAEEVPFVEIESDRADRTARG